MNKKVQIVALAKHYEKIWILLLQTNKERGEFWQNITGSVEIKEKYDEAAKRELEEETGLSTEEIKKLDCNFQFKNNRGKEVNEKCYYILLNKIEKIKIDTKEHQAFKWVEANKVSSTNYKFKSNFIAAKEAIDQV